MTGSHYADRATALRALALALPMIEAALGDPEVSETGFLCIVVLDPGLHPGDCEFERAVLAEHAFGRAHWDADYAAFARAKAEVAWRLGMSGDAALPAAPHRLRRGESLLQGGVCLDGIVVAASGAAPWFDEAFAVAVAANLRALVRERCAGALAHGARAAGDAER